MESAPKPLSYVYVNLYTIHQHADTVKYMQNVVGFDDFFLPQCIEGNT